jgi:hypothetical protein
MTMDWELAKYLELRAKTDQDLIGLIERRLDSGLEFAAEKRWSGAEQYRGEAGRLLPELGAVSIADLTRLEAKLAKLEDELDPQVEETESEGCCAN